MQQMAAEYKSEKEFARYAKAALRKISTAYAGLKFQYAKGGLILHPSLTAIAPAAKQQ